MDDYGAARAALEGCAAQVHGLATRLATHGLGGRWEGPSRRQCELRLVGLEDDLRLIARQLEVVASSFGIPDVRARLG